MNQLKDELVEETQRFMYAQSSKCSQSSRIIAYGLFILNVVLIFLYPTLINFCSYFGLLDIILFLMMDIVHYYKDAGRYYVELYRLDQYPEEEILKLHEQQMDKINKASHRMFEVKHIVLMLAVVLSIAGLFITFILVQQKTF